MMVEGHLSFMIIPTKRGVSSKNPIHAVISTGNLNVDHGVHGIVQQ